ncbi:hypothetical protein DUNSADRAFT_10893 [Dunaliella salina]|uniref:Uncharacterized protein n=1 Tax=Dunaliella salina TaxID=3046 RepID=A0ABQ7H4P5_DUNSA|nr:hypothetical protein DUNSADRAFT_10893 [Dunaliella salina]|eukprot:KAF5841830.1 hypothetical protein DUNSADRAFT_10893 [Dunaliella salina]
MPIIYEEDLAADSTGDGNCYWVNFTKPLFWWRVTAEHIAAGLAPSGVLAACVQQLSLKDLVNLQKLFLSKFYIPNGVKGRESQNQLAKCKTEQERSSAWARLEHLYHTTLKETYGAIPEGASCGGASRMQQPCIEQYYLQPMPSGLQVSELIELWQHIRGVPSEGDKSPTQGSMTNPAEENEQLQAAHKQRLELLKTLLCQPWPGMLKVRHENKPAITRDGMHSIMAFFIKVARKFASALPTIELTAQRARGAPLPDTAFEDASSTGSTALEEESYTSGDANLPSDDATEGGGGEEEEEEVERDALSSDPAPPPTPLQPHLLPLTPVKGEHHHRLLSADALSSTQNNMLPSSDGALQQNSIGGTASPPQPSQPGHAPPTSLLSSPFPPDCLLSNFPKDPSLAHTLVTPPMPHSLASPQLGVGLKSGHVSEHLEPNPSAVYSPTPQLLSPPRPKFWMPQLRQPSNPYIQLAPPELLLGPEPHHIPFSHGALLAHHSPMHSMAATPIGSQPLAPTHRHLPMGTQPHELAPRTAAQPHAHVGTRTGTVAHGGAPGAQMSPRSSLGTGKHALNVPPDTQMADGMWVGGWDAAALPKRRPPPPASHLALSSSPPSTPWKSDSTWVGGWGAAEAVPEHRPPFPATYFNVAPIPPSTPAKPHAQPRKPAASWLRSLLCLGAEAAGEGAPVAPGGPHNTRNHNRVAPA